MVDVAVLTVPADVRLAAVHTLSTRAQSSEFLDDAASALVSR